MKVSFLCYRPSGFVRCTSTNFCGSKEEALVEFLKEGANKLAPYGKTLINAGKGFSKINSDPLAAGKLFIQADASLIDNTVLMPAK